MVSLVFFPTPENAVVTIVHAGRSSRERGGSGGALPRWSSRRARPPMITIRNHGDWYSADSKIAKLGEIPKRIHTSPSCTPISQSNSLIV